MYEKDPFAEPHIQQRGEKKKRRRPAPGIEEDVRRLKMRVLFLTVLVAGLGASVFVLSIRLDKVVDDVNFLSEHFIALLDIIKGALSLG